MDLIRMIAPSKRYWDVPFSGYTTDRTRYDKFLVGERRSKAGRGR